MELRQLEYFVAVAEHLHFGRAAAALSIGQPAVSQQIARLERELGVALFDRSGRSVRLTDAGSRLVVEAHAVLAAVDRARAAVLAPDGREQPRILRLGSSSGMGDRLDAVLRALREDLPATDVMLTSAPTQARLERVLSGQLDGAFVRGVEAARGIELIEVWRDRLVVALPGRHPLADREVVDLRDLADVPLRIVPRRLNQPLVDLVMNACAAAGFVPVLAPHPDTLENNLATIGAGPPSWTVFYEAHARVLRPPLVAFRPLRPDLVMPTALAVRADAASRAVAPLLRACAAAADQGS
jgi:DNA-binding transcriptional LysR family regulator